MNLPPRVGRDSVVPSNLLRPGKSGLDGVSPYQESKRFMGRVQFKKQQVASRE